mgnify:CR=1 FL=1
MRAVELISKKRDGQALTREEIRFLIDGFMRGEIPDYQMAAWAMAVYFRGMSEEETVYLTEAMIASGQRVDLSFIQGTVVDKHSTGGIGDTTTLVLAPLVASCGVPVAKMSGRSLGFTGGTIDKLESIPGFCTQLAKDHLMRQVKELGLAVFGQSADLVPADKRLYALRDVTGTVASLPLIASSIMSKKIAAGAEKIVLDVKVGSGAFMKTLEEAVALADIMVKIGRRMGRETVAVISDMNQPLGRAVGCALEVREAVLTLRGEGNRRLLELCLVLGSHMLVLAGRATSVEEGRALLEEALAKGHALAKMKQWVAAQGGDPAVVDDLERLALAPYRKTLVAPTSGYVAQMDAQQLGEAAGLLGAGRQVKDEPVDTSVGLIVHRRLGEYVDAGEPLFTVYSRASEMNAVEDKLLQAVRFSPEPPHVPPLIYRIINAV